MFTYYAIYGIYSHIMQFMAYVHIVCRRIRAVGAWAIRKGAPEIASSAGPRAGGEARSPAAGAPENSGGRGAGSRLVKIDPDGASRPPEGHGSARPLRIG